MGVSPLTIQIMLECATCSEPGANFPDRSWRSEAAAISRDWLERNELINEDWRATDRGKAWVQFICSTPLPVQEWKLPDRTDKPEPV